jgi:hypothetical protein
LDSWATLPIPDGGQDVGLAAILISFATPMVWTALWPHEPRGSMSKRGVDPPHALARLGLCLVAVLQPMAAFPIPGTQLAIGSVALLLVTVLVAWDLLQTLPHVDRDAPRFRRWVVGLAGVLLIGTLLWRDVHHTRGRLAMTALDLPGASRLRLPVAEVDRYHWLVGSLVSRCDTFIAVPNGHNSLYLWSGLRPPTGFNATLWPFMLSDAQQQQVIDALEGHTRVCVVRDRSDGHLSAPRTPLVAYLQDRFETRLCREPFEVCERP